MSPRTTATRHLGLWSAVLAASASALCLGCGAGNGGSLGSDGSGQGGSNTSGGGMGAVGTGAGGAVSTGGVNGTGLGFAVGGDVNGAGGLPEGQCAATSVAAEKIVEIETDVITETVTSVTPAAIYIMQDLSGSMIDKWGYALDALTQFVNDPSSTGLHVGVTYFPAAIPISDCTGNGFVTPEVGWDILTLPGPGTFNQAIVDNLLQHAPFGIGTPIEDALRGVIRGCQAFETANPTIPCFALLITDGEPSNCAQDAPSLAAIATQGLASGIPTYTVGMPGANFAMLDAIAVEGGTDCNGATAGSACNASNGPEFLASLSAIRETVTDTIETVVEREVERSVPLDCEWVVPTGEDADLSTANVDLTDNTTGAKTALFQVEDPAKCAEATEPAWYFDPPPPATPTKLVACPSTCDVVKAADARIDISLGCEPRIIR